MSAAWSAAGDFDPRLCGIMQAAGALLGQARDAMHGMSGPDQTGPDQTGRDQGGPNQGSRDQGGREHVRPGRRGAPWARRGGPWERGFGFSGPGGWPGGPGGSEGGFSGGPRGWWPGQPGPSRGPKAGRGDVRAAILALLREGPRNGYQIMSEIEERSGGAWRPSPGAVYPALQLLADEGLIAGEESGGRRTFSLTEAGRRHIEDDPEAARPAWEAMAQDEPGEMPGLFAQAARLGGSIVQLAHAGTPEQIRAAERLLEQTRRQMYQILASDEPADAGDEPPDE
jgi:DNA-binding PadR family transcriptional regulator